MILTYTPMYAAALAVMMNALSIQVIIMRAKTGISIYDGGNKELAVRIRRHGNFIESVPTALILMLICELIGISPIWLNAAGILLILGRTLHAIGLDHEDAKALPRIMGGSLTNIALFILIINTIIHVINK